MLKIKKQPAEQVKPFEANTACQTEDIPILTSEVINELESQIVQKDETIDEIKKAFDHLHLKNDELSSQVKDFKMLNKKNNEKVNDVLESNQKAVCILKQQIFAQLMMENLINDLLDLAKWENNQFQLKEEYFNLSETVYEALQMLQLNASQIGVTL